MTSSAPASAVQNTNAWLKRPWTTFVQTTTGLYTLHELPQIQILAQQTAFEKCGIPAMPALRDWWIHPSRAQQHGNSRQGPGHKGIRWIHCCTLFKLSSHAGRWQQVNKRRKKTNVVERFSQYMVRITWQKLGRSWFADSTAKRMTLNTHGNCANQIGLLTEFVSRLNRSVSSRVGVCSIESE